MALPDFPTLMRPLLEHLSDGSEHDNEEISAALADKFYLSEEERTRLLPKGKQLVFTNRVAWAKARLKQAGLIEKSKPGFYCISPKGTSFLSENSGPLEIQDLGNTTSTPTAQPSLESMTPEALIEQAYRQVREKLAADLLDLMRSCSPSFFEQLVVDLFAKIYGIDDLDDALNGKVGDGGIDGILKQDPFGLDTIYLQAKRWDGSVGRPEIQKFQGALAGRKGNKGIFVTTGSFTKDAQDYSSFIESKVILIDGVRLADLLIEYKVGVAVVSKYEIGRIDHTYFSPQEE